MADPPPARLLDLSRLASRAGRVHTGIDRVELAYLRAFLAETVPVFGLVKTAWGFVLLDKGGCHGFLDRLEGCTAWGPVDRLSRLRSGLPVTRQQAEADLRRLCIARCLPLGLRRMLLHHLPPRSSYVNVGHSNLSDQVLNAVRRALNGQIAVMIHDTIPLDFPHFQRAGSVARFGGLLRQVQRYAGLVLCNSARTQADVIRHLSPWGRVPDTVVAHLGVDIHHPDMQATLPAGFDENRPCFVTIGTIEPRKNHMFLFDLWADLHADGPDAQMPQLLICGTRGWNNDAVFARLDNDPMMGRHIFEMPDLTDGQMAALLMRAHAALFPSHAEGFGLPPAEALALGVPVICNTLEIYREILCDYPVYASVEDRYLWRQEIRKLASGQVDGQLRHTGFKPFSWQAHFNGILNRL
ncbi:MAG: glycosyltransferase family 4 protein [Rhodobacterales bacterium]